MIPVDPGLVGSLTDVVTLALVGYWLLGERDRVDTIGAGTVALARQHREVDDDGLQAELEVDDVEVDSMHTTIVDGPEGRHDR